MAHARSTRTEDEWAADGAVCGAERRDATADRKKSCFFNHLIETHLWFYLLPVLVSPMERLSGLDVENNSGIIIDH